MLQFQYGAGTEKGRGKVSNQDHFICEGRKFKDGTVGIFGVADGIGSLSSGEVASGIVCAQIKGWWIEHDFQSVREFKEGMKELPFVMLRINTSIMQKGFASGISMGTTFSALVLCERDAAVLHIGDSRIYRFHKKSWLAGRKSIEQLSEDDSASVIRRDAAGREYYKEVLTACLGREENIFFQWNQISVQKGERFLICSDGIYKKNRGLLDMERLMRHISASDPEYCNKLVSYVRQQGETDDITVVCLVVD